MKQGEKREQASRPWEFPLGSAAARFAGATLYLLPGSERKATVSKYIQGYSQKQVIETMIYKFPRSKKAFH